MSVVALLPIGLVFDRYGAKFSGVAGAAGVASSSFLISFVLWSAERGSDESTNWLFFYAVTVMELSCMLNSYAINGLIWHFPGYTSFVIALAGASYQVSAILPLVFESIARRTNARMSVMMSAFSAAVLASAALCFVAVPSQEEFYAQAKRVLGVPIPKSKATSGLALLKDLRISAAVLWADIEDHIWLIAGSSLAQVFVVLYSSMASSIGEAFFESKEDGMELAKFQVETTAAIGPFLAPLIGKIADHFGFVTFASLNGGITGITAAAFMIHSWPAQIVTTIGCVIIGSTMMLLLNHDPYPTHPFPYSTGMQCFAGIT